MATIVNADWTGTPFTHPNANILTLEHVSNVRVVHLQQARIRGSYVFGTFKLAQGAEIELHSGKRRIEVECLWFGRKPPTTWMHITVLCNPIFEDHYTGMTVVSIGR